MVLGNSEENVVTGTINALERLGTETFVYLYNPAIEEAFTVRIEDHRRHEEGESFKVGLPAESCHLFDANDQAFKRTQAPQFD